MEPSGEYGPRASRSSDAQLPEFVPVLIVGGGPVGLLQGLLLSRLGGRTSIFQNNSKAKKKKKKRKKKERKKKEKKRIKFQTTIAAT